MEALTRELRFSVEEAASEVSAIYVRADGAIGLYVFAHGAGAGMRHRFMEDIAARLAANGIATFRYQFPFMEHGLRRPDAPRVAQAAVRSAVGAARAASDDALPIVAGGKSFGGRMSSEAQAARPLDGVRGLAFLGFPLHAPGRSGTARAAHLASIDVPMLFLQGTRDKLAGLAELRPLLEGLGEKARLHVVEGGDHSFAVPKRSGRSADQVMDELAGAIRAFIVSVG